VEEKAKGKYGGDGGGGGGGGGGSSSSSRLRKIRCKLIQEIKNGKH
jgi:hypothetical protein